MAASPGSVEILHLPVDLLLGDGSVLAASSDAPAEFFPPARKTAALAADAASSLTEQAQSKCLL